MMKSCTQCKEIKKDLEEIENMVYAVNAYISGRYITHIEKLNDEGIIRINFALGDIIKHIRKVGGKYEI